MIGIVSSQEDLHDNNINRLNTGTPIITNQLNYNQQNRTVNEPDYNTNNDYESTEPEDSDISDHEDWRLYQLRDKKKKIRKKKKHQWETERRESMNVNGINIHGGDIGIEDISSHQYIGDTLLPQNKLPNTLRIATNNINKGAIWKIEEEVKTWFIKNNIDIMIISDPAIQEKKKRIIWSKTEANVKIPGMVLIGNKYVGILLDESSLADKADYGKAKFSDSGRSLYINIRLGGRDKLGLIATYMPPNPSGSIEETEKEFRWISECKANAENGGAWVIIAGDINNYQHDGLDRNGTSERTNAAINRSEWYCQWLREQALTSAFRVKHPQLERYTYERRTENGFIRTNLDDIIISDTKQQHVKKSGIGLNEIVLSDHIGTPFTDILVNSGEQSRTVQQQWCPIKHVQAKARSPEEYLEYKWYVQDRIEKDPNILIAEPDESMSDQIAMEWLEKAIKNIHNILYQSAKQLWGESSKAKRIINRNVAIKKSNKCTGKWKAIMRLSENARHEAFKELVWPMWVLDPKIIPEECPHKKVAEELIKWMASAESDPERNDQWYNAGWHLWKKALRLRRNWRGGKKMMIASIIRKKYTDERQYKKLIANILGPKPPPINIHSVITLEQEDEVLHTSKQAVKDGLTEMLNNWIPPLEKTVRPRYLDTGLEEDKLDLPEFVRQWMMNDIEKGGTHTTRFYDDQGNSLWDKYQYNEAIQNNVDRAVSKGVAPGEGGVAQELWIHAPDVVRRRERVIINLIFKLGKVPMCLKDKQMVFLPKAEHISNILDRRSSILPPWRPITVMRALSTRMFTAVSQFFDGKITNHMTQHGFQRDKTAHDAAILTALLFDRAREQKEPIHVISKDCLKCFDRIPAWVMELIYRQIGVPHKLINLVIDGLGKGRINVRTAYGWVDTGLREFGIGQGSVMSIMHIGCYMDLLQNQQNNGIDPIHIKTHQGEALDIHGITYVDDQVDYSTSVQGIQQRAEISNLFTGNKATGGVFGASKSFYLFHEPNRIIVPEVKLMNGLNELVPVKTVSPAEGFKHLGVQQSTDELWSTTIMLTWEKFEKEAKQVERMNLSAEQIRYIVNHVWIPRFTYRMVATTAIKIADQIDSRIRRIVRRCLKLPHSISKEIYYDTINGIGLHSCRMESAINRVNELLRILNTDTNPVRIVVEDTIERYQRQTGMTSCPIEKPLHPPSHINSWIARTIRNMADLQISTKIKWKNLPDISSRRPKDKSLWDVLTKESCQALIHLNYRRSEKFKYVGDLCNVRGDTLTPINDILQRQQIIGVNAAKLYQIYEELKCSLCQPGTVNLRIPVGYSDIRGVMRGYIRTVNVPPQSMLITSQFRVNNDSIEYTGYEIGLRIGTEIQDDPYGNGTLIRVQWYHTRNEQIGIFTPRPDSTLWEYDDICIPINVTWCRRSTHSKPRILIWNDTEEHGVLGPNDRSICIAAFQRCKNRYDQVIRNGQYDPNCNICINCGRYIRTETCMICNTKHHPQCGHSRTKDLTMETSTRLKPIDSNNGIEAGDGSVTDAGTANASGTWSYLGPTGGYIGKLDVYWNDINSTRCELHALVIGIKQSGDCGYQICDNKAAISLFNKVRQYRKEKKKLYLKYSNPYRNELCALHKLMETDGTRTITWVKSHQEGKRTDNGMLRSQREALAMADSEAARAHSLTYHQNYDDIIINDRITLLSLEQKTILGNTRHALVDMANRITRIKWLNKLKAKPEAKQTIPIDGIPIRKYLYMDNSLARFYWRTITHSLHTGIIKHRMYNGWNPRCRGCHEQHIDTQTHRFSLDKTICPITRCLSEEMQGAIEKTLLKYIQPDTTVYLPLRDHQEAQRRSNITRGLWNHTRNEMWTPMIQIDAGIWFHAGHQKMLWPEEVQNEQIATCLVKEQILVGRRKARSITPVSIIQTIKSCSPTVARLEFIPTELMMCITSGRPRRNLPIPHPFRMVIPANDHDVWLIDDTYASFDEMWWEQWHKKTQQNIRNKKQFEHWIITSRKNSSIPYLTNANIQWMVRIPKGQIRTRTDLTIRQFGSAPPLAEIWKNSTHSIWIGYVSDIITHERNTSISKNWMQFCLAYQQESWFFPVQPTDNPPTRYLLADVLGWFSRGEPCSNHEARCMDWLSASFPLLYEAADGLKYFPSPTITLLQWAKSLVPFSASSMLRDLLTSCWHVLHDHWVHSSAAMVGLIIDPDELALLHQVNSMISTHRRLHDQLSHPLNTMIQRHRQVLRRRQDRWQSTHNYGPAAV